MDDSTTSDVAVVTVFLFAHVDGDEWTMRDTGVGGVSALTAPRSRFRGLTWDLQAPKFGSSLKVFFG
jgi:hypothetical protein